VSSVVAILLLVLFAAARPVLRAVQSSIEESFGDILPSRTNTTTTTKSFHPNTEEVFNASPGQRLRLDLDTGSSVDIRGWDEPRVQVRVQYEGRDKDGIRVYHTEDARGRIVQMKYEGKNSSYSSSMKMLIRVPRRFD